ncbi:MAG: hypothetical protein ACLU4N_17105 [Butyricimonas faecihominis]
MRGRRSQREQNWQKYNVTALLTMAFIGRDGKNCAGCKEPFLPMLIKEAELPRAKS